MTLADTKATVGQLAHYVHRLQAAQNRSDVGAVYLQMVGYDIADDSDDTMDDIRDLALDYVREVCYAYGIPVSQVGLG